MALVVRIGYIELKLLLVGSIFFRTITEYVLFSQSCEMGCQLYHGKTQALSRVLYPLFLISVLGKTVQFGP